MKLRSYQQEAITNIKKSFENHQKVLLESPTGSGKTIIAKFFIEYLIEKGFNILFTANRRSLIDQTADKFDNMIDYISIIMSTDKRYNNQKKIQIGTLQSLQKRSKEIKPDFIIFDEVHYGYKGTMIKNLLKEFPESKILGLSATPIDNKGFLLNGFNKYLKTISVKKLIELGFLVDTENYTAVELDLKDVEIKKTGDYDIKDLSKKMQKKDIMTNLIDEWKRVANGLKTIVFCVNIEHAESIKKQFEKISNNVIIIHSNLKDQVVKENIKLFENTKGSILINVDMFTTGNDVSDIECIVIARPTKVLRLYIQMIGRGLRIHDGKTKCIFIDVGNCMEEHGLPTEEREYKLAPIYNNYLDKKLEIIQEYGDHDELRKSIGEKTIKKLVKVHSLADVYSQKVYIKESDFQDDVIKILKKFPSMFYWRQNSGSTKEDNRWIHYTSVYGLPDITVLFLNSIYVGLELKIIKRKNDPSEKYLKKVFTKHQKKTLPDFQSNNIYFFVITNCMELFDLILWLKKKIRKVGNTTIIENGISEIQDEFYFDRDRLKIGWED